jgi:hypothetical protein
MGVDITCLSKGGTAAIPNSEERKEDSHPHPISSNRSQDPVLRIAKSCPERLRSIERNKQGQRTR